MTDRRAILLSARPRPTASGGWTPATLSPLAWYYAHADYITESGGAVSQWSDRSGNAHHVTQSAAGSKPAWSADGWTTGQGAVTFDGSDMLDSSGSIATAMNGDDTPFSVLGVIRLSADLDGGVATWEKVGGTAVIRCRTSNGGPVLRFTAVSDSGGAAGNDENATLSATTGNVVAWIRDGTTSRLRTDGEAEDAGTVNVGTVTAEVFRVGASTTGADIYFDGEIAELVVVDRAVTADEYAAFRAYAQALWSGLP